MASTHGVALTLPERFWAYVEPAQDGCLLWTGQCSPKGYGRFYVGGSARVVQAHRFAYEQEHGPIAEGLTLDHLCRVRNCVNAAHLEPVTNRENVLRGDTLPAINARKTHCIHGHPFDEVNTRHSSNGDRYCRTCVVDRNRRYAKARRIWASR